MNLYLFPEAACFINGYGIVVEAAYRQLDIKEEDVVVWMTTIPKEKMLHLRQSDYVIQRPKLLSLKSIINTIKETNRSEPWISDLSFLKGMKFNEIYCDETIFYHSIRKMFPNKKLTVRFHNSFARIHDRLHLINRNVDFMYKLTLHNMYKLERDVMNDDNVFKIFLSDEDRLYYTSHYGKTSDSSTFDYNVNIQKMIDNRVTLSLDNRIVWYGGVESHKKAAIDWFINDIFSIVRESIPNIEFHLWGKNTEQFNNTSINIFGHGFFNGEGMPSKNSLFINPDITGGGIKIKLMSMLEAGVPVISSPFGFEGYKYDIVDNEYCIVQEEEKWADFIISYIKKYSNHTN